MTHALSISSKVWIVLSDCPSVCGWNAVLMYNFVPIAFCKYSQNLEVNLGSLSDTIDIGTPCSRTILFKYFSANCSSEHPQRISMKCVDFVSLSMITHTALIPLIVRGNPVTKSIVILSHFHTGIRRGCNMPDGA